MSMGKVYKQAIRRVFAKKYQDELMAVYWGREDDAIHVITTLRHYVHKIAGGHQEIGLAAEKCKHLQHIGHLGAHCGLTRLMHVGEEREAARGASLASSSRPRSMPGPARRSHAGPVGLVEAGLEADPETQPRTDLRQPAGNPTSRSPSSTTQGPAMRTGRGKTAIRSLRRFDELLHRPGSGPEA